MLDSIYDFKINSLQSKEIDFATFKDKVILVVNTASKCGFTPQYTDLQQFHETYKDKGLVVIGFPCNQFGGQEPGDSKEISENCLVNYGVTFLITEKVEVNGPNQTTLFEYLKQSLPGLLGSEDIKWNFTKFLINRSGTPIKRYAPTTEPSEIEPDIQNLLN